MRKLVVLFALVIVLVSLNWFRDLLAQDLSNLSDAEKAALLQNLGKTIPAKQETDRYETPPIFDSTVTVLRPGDQERGYPAGSQQTVGQLFPIESDRTRLLSFDELRPFGTELFVGPQEAIPPDDVVSDDRYVLGPGDNVIIYLWGRVEKEYNLTVDREGKIIIPKIGELAVWGKSLGRFKTILKKEMSKVYSEFDLAVSLGKIRSIRIYLTGEVHKPGAYTVSSLTSPFNALYLAGGPTENGSMRAVRVMRGDKAVMEIDLYRFLLSGDNSCDIRLESGDAIFIPVAKTRVAIRGEVMRPAVYELTGSETSVDLLRLAGGPTPEAYLSRVMLERISDRDEWQVFDLDLGADSVVSTTDLTMKDGDRLTVYSIFEAKKNTVAIFGQVKHPGYYERNDSTCVSSLVEQGGLPDYDVVLERANLFRRHSDWRAEIIPVNLGEILSGTAQDIILKDRDSLHIYSIEDIEWEKHVNISGEVKRPGEYPYYDSMTVGDLIFLSGSFTKSASRLQAEIGRVDPEGNVILVYVNMSDEAVTSTILHEEDRVFIRQLPEWQRHRTVTLEGEVAYPGEYILSGRKETLFTLLKRAGSFSPRAFPMGIVFERPSIGETLGRLRIVEQLEKSTRLVEDSLGNVKSEIVFEYDSASVNRIAIDVDLIIETDGREGDIILEPGDRIFVPSTPSGISVLGAVGHNGTIQFKSNTSVRDYIKRAGDFAPRADKGKTRLIKANGEVLAGGGILGHKVGIGDVVVVPTKIEREHDYLRTLSTILTATTGALTTILLITKLD